MDDIRQYKIKDFNIIWHDRLTSTNEYAWELAFENTPEWTVAVADFQTKGKGQGGNVWESNYRENLCFSVVIYPKDFDAANMFYISKAVSLAICDALKVQHIEASIKWPNDIYVGDQKIAGILIEQSVMNHKVLHSIIGIGLNVNQSKFSEWVPNPVSMSQLLNKEIPLEFILHDILLQMNGYMEKIRAYQFSEIDKLYMNRLYRKTGYHLYKAGEKEFEAQIHEVEPRGTLVLVDKQGHKSTYQFKEVEFMIPRTIAPDSPSIS